MQLGITLKFRITFMKYLTHIYLHVMRFVKRIHSKRKRKNKKCFLFLFHKKAFLVKR